MIFLAIKTIEYISKVPMIFNGAGYKTKRS